MEDNHYVIKTLDNTPRFLFWGMDEFCILVAPLFGGLVFGSFLMMLTGPIGMIVYRRLSKKYPRGLLKHKIYWNLPTKTLQRSGFFKNLPDSHKRDLIL